MKARRKEASNGDQRAAHSSTPDLPIGVVMEILCKLPIKTLMAAKSVSKSWRDLISGDTHFAKLHLSGSPTELLLRLPRNDSPSTVFYLGKTHGHSNSVSEFMSSPVFDLPNLSARPQNSKLFYGDTRTIDTELFYVNTCNGLVCFCNYPSAPRTYAMICNPITGEFITVDGPETEEERIKWTTYALGFSGKANRYKVFRMSVRIEDDPVTRQESMVRFAQIRTIEKGSSWRNVGYCPYLIGAGSMEYVFLEGKLHFRHSLIIACACFDLDSEQFHQVPVPPILSDIVVEDTSTGRMGVLGGCLFLTNFVDSYSFDLWVMEEYGVKDSWTKAFTYRSSCEIDIGSYIPLKYMDNGGILMAETHGLVSCHPEKWWSLERVVLVTGLQVIAYRPSLLRLKDVLMGYDALVRNAKPRRREQGCEGSSSGKG